ncbi:hypothetical protein BST46_26205 [Mycobacterium timonense]|uniref:PH domain-containing protein n=1 Tax=Mycobacterium timonense TaxID=701043 RepID=A0ABX3TEA4_9MYCO|nr:hypothetical protein BST46_26205 [Mycobacterium timonense]
MSLASSSIQLRTRLWDLPRIVVAETVQQRSDWILALRRKCDRITTAALGHTRPGGHRHPRRPGVP